MISTTQTLEADKRLILTALTSQSGTGVASTIFSYFFLLSIKLLEKTEIAHLVAYLQTNMTSIERRPVFCHSQRLGAIDQSCTAVPIDVHDFESVLYFANRTQIDLPRQPADDTPGFELPPAENVSFIAQQEPFRTVIPIAMQLMLAATRFDIGNILPNNFLVYPDVLNATVPEDAFICQDLIQLGSTLSSLGDESRPAAIASQYLCHFPQRKPLGSAIISVLVATLSMFGTVWAVFLFTATFYEQKRHPQGNLCDCHLEYQRVMKGDMQEVADGVSSQGLSRGEV
ncbi:hypothetical protein FRB94_009303 [Tulasnella sp. JGI-2019a]|nr:hypothetical protein FRB93_008175 [Tulasnella sp. JGI-2019a]KAG8995309.1 hypothetical protein FRB94_009303 [Tulasnella sp. JGI-2019a]